MDLHQLQSAFRTSPAIQLLRSPNAPYFLDFLHAQFKTAQKLTIPDDELRGALRDYQESVRELDPEALPDTPRSLPHQVV